MVEFFRFFFSFETGSLSSSGCPRTYYVDWSLTHKDSPPFASQSARIKGTHHYAWPRLKQFLKHRLNRVSQLKITDFVHVKSKFPFLVWASMIRSDSFLSVSHSGLFCLNVPTLRLDSPRALCHQSEPVCRRTWSGLLLLNYMRNNFLHLFHP